MIRPVDALLEFLHAQHAQGVSHVHLDPAARSGLRVLHEHLRTGKPPAPTPALTPAAPVPGPVGNGAALSAAGTLLDEGVPVVPPSPMPQLVVEGATKAEKLATLSRQAAAWAPARALGSLREVMVFATGDAEARIMLIGEAPGYEEEKKLEPFVGPAGQQLDKILKAMGLERSEVYISNIVKFRPATARQTTNNRPPTPAEIAACMPLVREEIRVIGPQCIIALGGSAAEGLLGDGGSVTSLRGSWHEFEGTPVRVTYHPSYLLRSANDIRTKRMVWEDMLAVMELTGMPISDKQRGFFLPKN